MAKFNPKPFGKYFLIEKLATGGMAEIYKAKTFGAEGFEKLLAIKRILPHCSEDKEFIDMLIDEAKLSVLLSHTNIVQVYDLGKVGDDYFISMEFINGINLREVLNSLKETNSSLGEELVLYIVSEICKGLDYAHSKKDTEGKPLNIVHRDISPQNILLSLEGEVKIVDFGIAKAAMNISHTMAGILKGKISYMSPEQALGKPIDRKTDIFSAGLMLYEFLTGEKFFTGETQFEVLKKIRTTRVTEKSLPADFAEPVKKILAKALAYSTKERYDNAGDFQIDLTRHLYTTYADFTPRKLKKLMDQLFASEMKVKEKKKDKESPLDSQTRSILVSSKEQENIVHRQTQGISPPGDKQSTQTFMESFVSGQNEPSITQTRTQLPEDTGEAELEDDLDMEATPTPMPETAQPPAEEFEPEPVEPEPEPIPVPVVTKPKKKKEKKGGLGKIVYPIAALLVVGVGLWSYFKTDWFKGAPPPEPKIYGSLLIKSTPEGAQIFLGDQETQLRTPSTLKNIELGITQTVTLRLPRHKEWSKTVTLKDATPLSLNPTLEVIPVGTLKITSTPAGANIIIDGKDTGKKTPTTLEDLPLSKTYTLKLEMEKHYPVEERITVYSIEPIEFNKKLEEIKYGSLQVSSTPTGAEIFLNNTGTGKKTPATLGNLEVGKRFAIRIKKPGYQDITRSVEIKTAGITPLRERLTKIQAPKPIEKVEKKVEESQKKVDDLAKQRQIDAEKARQAKQARDKQKDAERKKTEEKRVEEKKPEEKPATQVARVSVSSNPRGASVYVNGANKGTTPGTFQIPAGKSVQITLSKKNYTTWTKAVKVKPGKTTALGTISLKSRATTTIPKGGSGIVVIDSNPSGASVLLNGSPYGKTPIRVTGLNTGTSYTFTVKKSGYKTWKRSVVIGAGSKSFYANLKK